MTASDSVHQAVQYIYDHISEELSVDSVADAVCFSRYHFSRVFKAFTGESLYGFIKRLRLERAAFRLVRLPALSVTEIAAEAGMSSSNFAVAFREHFGSSPAEYRKQPPQKVRDSLGDILALMKNRERSVEETARIKGLVSIKILEEMILYGEKYRGRYSEVGPVWDHFCSRMFSDPDLIWPPQFIGISRDDPMIADEESCWYDITARVKQRKGPGTIVLPAGEYACLRFTGPVDLIGRGYNELISLWLPESGRILGDGPLFEIYLTGPDDNRQITADVCAPLKP